MSVVWRHDRNHEHRKSRGFVQADPELVNVDGKVRLRLRYAVLDIHLIGIDVGLNAERHSQLHRPIVGVGRLHIEHIVHAVHLLLDRSGDRLLDGDGVRSGVGRGSDDLGWHDLGELGQRQTAHGDETDDDSENGDDHRDDWPINEKGGDHG